MKHALKQLTLSSLLLLALILCFASCNGKPDAETGTTENDPASGGNTPASCQHNVVIDPAAEATCTEDGRTEGSHCSLCNEILVAQRTIPAKHIYDKETGFCSRCNTYVTSEGLQFELNDTGTAYILTGIGTSQDTDIYIPSKHEGLPVISIGEEAFYECTELTSITIPAGVTSIGDWAFRGCT